MADVGHTLHELCFTYPGGAISPQLTMPEELPMESNSQTPEIAHKFSFFFLITSWWHRCQLPFGWFPVLLGIGGTGGRMALHAPKESDPELGVAERDVLQAHVAPICSHWTTEAASPGRSQVTVLGTWGHWAAEGRTPALQWNTSPLLSSGSCCCVSDT